MTDQFLRCHGNGEAFKRYSAISHKFTEEFNNITLEVMTEVYIREQMGRKTMPDRNFVNLQNCWQYIAEELGVLREYPYNILKEWSPGHPFARQVAVEGKKKLGIAS